MNNEIELANVVRRYIEFFNNPNGTSEELSNFYAPEIVWQEMPNRFAPNGRTVRYDQMLVNFQTGQKFINPQHYEIAGMVVQGDTVALQLDWKGTAVQTLGPFKAGTDITAQVASFLKFQDGRIISQIDYPCYPALPE